MSLWTELREAIRQAILLRERVERLIADVEKAESRLLDHDRRLTRIETMIELAGSRRLPEL